MPLERLLLRDPGMESLATPSALVRRVATHDVDDQALLLDQWNQRYDQLSAGAFDGQLCEAALDGIRVFCESTNQALHQRGALPEGLCGIGIPLEMEAPGSFVGQACDANALYLFSGAAGFDFHSSRRLVMAGVSLHASLLRAIGLQNEQLDLHAELSTPQLVRLEPAAAESLRSFMREALGQLQQEPGIADHSGTRHALTQSITSRFVAALARGRAAEPQRLDPSRRMQLIDQAEAHVRERPDEAVHVADLCRALSVSRRTLQYCFQDVLGISPMQYLRAVRLNAARRDIKRGRSVTEAACGWGFWHLSRFAGDYRQLFDELPSRTASRYAAAQHRS